jgi:CheY-like chemotaxis protein
MDDEPLVRSVAEQMLRHLGYEASTAPDGESAIALYREAMEGGKRFDAVLVDLTVPGGVGGVETAARLRAFDPGARVIVSSGYSSDPIMAEYPRHGFCAVMSKPYTVRELGRTLKDALEAPLPPIKG